MGSRLSALVLTAALLASPLATDASNLRFLEFSPSAFFDEEDWALLRGAAKKLLDDAPDGDSTSWKNDKTGHNGTLQVLDTYEDFGTTCRRMKVYNDAIQVSATRVVNMCRNKQGEWKILN